MSSSTPLKIRQAELRDLPRITAVCLAGLPDDPTFDFLWRYRHQYPDDNSFFWQQRLKENLFDPKKTLLVAEETLVSDTKREDRGEAVSTIVAFALWERNGKASICPPVIGSLLKYGSFPTLHRYVTKLENCAISKEYVRRDGDRNRMAAFSKTMDGVQKKYWETLYPHNYHLLLLATHPEYRRRGAGTALSKWGIEKGLSAGMDIGVEASPMGFPLYKHLGFVLLEVLMVEPQHDDARLPVKVMVFEKNEKTGAV